MIGSRPMKAAATVIIFGRARLTAPWTIASSSSAASQLPSRLRLSYDRSRKSSMKTPVSASRPSSAIMPTQAAIETL